MREYTLHRQQTDSCNLQQGRRLATHLNMPGLRKRSRQHFTPFQSFSVKKTALCWFKPVLVNHDHVVKVEFLLIVSINDHLCYCAADQTVYYHKNSSAVCLHFTSTMVCFSSSIFNNQTLKPSRH